MPEDRLSTRFSKYRLPYTSREILALVPKCLTGSTDNIYETFRYNRQKKKILRELEVLVIDEVSMVRADLLDVIDAILREYKDCPLPFGGVQVVLIGDVYQLP